jgi:Zn-finger nucleic acid-binding protein
VRLIACHACHAHIDVTHVDRARVRCACGAIVENRPPEPIDVPVHRCAACGAGLEEDATTCSWCGAAIERDPSRLGLVCPECFARTVEGGRFCVGCGVEIRPCPVGEAEADLACPACETALHAVTVGRVVVHECAGCGGTWVRARDFDAIVERIQAGAEPSASAGLGTRRARHPVSTRDPVVYRRCPECGQVMHRRNFGRASGIIVDWCREHGTWFDATELQAVAAYVRAGGLDDRPRELPEDVTRAMRAFERGGPPGRAAAGSGALADLLLSLLT